LLDTKGVFEEDIIEVQHQWDTKSVSTQLASHFNLKPSMSPTIIEEREYMSHVPYASVVGSLIYAMVCTKSNLSQVILMFSRHARQLNKPLALFDSSMIFFLNFKLVLLVLALSNLELSVTSLLCG